MKKNKIFVQDFYSYKNVVDIFGKTTDDIKILFATPEKFKLILFSGGADVNPKLYGHKSPNYLCNYSKTRDTIDIKIFKLAIKHNIKMVGICRGLQFLNVMSGGTLIHHINNHTGSLHYFISPRINKKIKVNSLHHQMVIPHKDSFIIGTTTKQISDIYFGDNDKQVDRQELDVEALYMPTINACGVQYHPEMMNEYSNGFQFFNRMIEEFLNLNKKDFKCAYTITNNKIMGINNGC